MGIEKLGDLNECKQCQLEKKKSPQANFITEFSKENDMDSGAVLSYFSCLSIAKICWLGPGVVPSYLPYLSIAEEMLIARTYVYIDFRRVKGCQYKYSDHIVNFMQNTTKIINHLLSFPTELQVVILKLFSSFVNDSTVHEKFARTFWVQCKNIKMWLHFLVKNHPDNKNVVIDKEHIFFLPSNDTVINYFSIVLHNKVDVNEHDNNVEEKTMINEATINETIINEITINGTTINEITIDETTVKKPQLTKSRLVKLPRPMNPVLMKSPQLIK